MQHVGSYAFHCGKGSCVARLVWDASTVILALQLLGRRQMALHRWLGQRFRDTWLPLLDDAKLHEDSLSGMGCRLQNGAESEVPVVRRALSTTALLMILLHMALHPKDATGNQKALTFLSDFMLNTFCRGGCSSGGVEG